MKNVLTRFLASLSGRKAQSGIDLLIESLADRDNVVTDARREDLVLALKSDAIEGSKGVAAFLQRLLNCRAHKMSDALRIAEKLMPCPELVEIVQEILSSPAVVVGVLDPLFPPEVYTDDKVGWSGSYQIIHDIAREALQGWNIQPRLDFDRIAEAAVHRELATATSQIGNSSPDQQALLDSLRRFAEGTEQIYKLEFAAATLGINALPIARAIIEKDPESELARAASVALGEIRSPDVLPIISKVLLSRNNAVRFVANQSLHRLASLGDINLRNGVSQLAKDLLQQQYSPDLKASFEHLAAL